jgi:protein-S-isoprenylcysteine O-methyltransferase Ste14
MLTYLFALAIPVSAAALLYARWEYRKRGKLTLVGLLMLCVMLFLPNLMLHYATRVGIPNSPLDAIGVVVGLAGLMLCLASITLFRSILKVLAMSTGELTRSGSYRWSRNPQYVGWMLFLLGYALNDWSGWCLAALAVVAISLHLLVLVEEEHLRRTFGEQYVDFCQAVPRYLALGRLRI